MGQTKQNAVARKHAALVQDYKRVFTSVSGKRILQDLMVTHGIFSSSFREGDPHLTAFQEGERNVVLRILAKLKIDTEEFSKMLEEMDRNVDNQ